MNVKALGIYLGDARLGTLFRYGDDVQPILRFVADDGYARADETPVLSLSMLADRPEAQRALWANVTSRLFNGRYSNRNGWLLPPFFQGLLPEGVFRDHVAAVRGCDPRDHFEMLAACGRDLPGNVYARPVVLDREQLTHLVTQDADSLEMTVTAEPMDDGVSVSGVQPKVGVIRDGDRYVGRTRMRDTHIIAKLPVVGYALLPELEALSLELARAAGVDACEARLEPLAKLAVEHRYDLGQAGAQTAFLAVTRFDRAPGTRFHVEDFAQILGVQPEDKYSRSYLEVAAVMLAIPSMGEAAVHELLRRMTVNELLGNPDMHLKNIGVIYRDGRTPSLSPAYDIVAYSAYQRRSGHALFILPPRLPPRGPSAKTAGAGTTVEQDAVGTDRGALPAGKPALSPAMLRTFCNRLGLLERPASAVIRKTVLAASKHWPRMIADAPLTTRQKANLEAHLEAHPLIVSLRRRGQRAEASAD
ncbi:type II toxin-antitoxin system HipA family toxin [Chitinasiproducens palmae]|uniref:Serine/threonine-protein kinase HipA n=1 Tax=Chitinasiproducens palmae TaxID=1770053 RepID=A0A1H2PK07_9BURK|nr:type II toxin-antitoxin system HipA family toxin [Chitinasiproducens palmae]SDV46731.1 serine/threonine-protein kinase HipA [Chitinasiproducens palmae]